MKNFLRTTLLASLLVPPIASAAVAVDAELEIPQLTQIALSKQIWKRHVDVIGAEGLASYPSLPSGDGCTLIPNPEFKLSAAALADASAALKSGLANGLATMTPAARGIMSERAATAGLKTQGQKTESQIIRRDAAGNILLRVVFWYGSSLDSSDKAALEETARANLAGATRAFQQSGIKVVFEFAAVERYTGSWYETADVSDPQLVIPGQPHGSLLFMATQPHLRYDVATNAFIPNPNYPISVASLTKNQANIGVVMSNLNWTGMANMGGVLSPAMDFLSTAQGVYPALPSLVVSARALNEEVATGQMLAHEIGHVIGQSHGPDTDGAVSTRAEMDYRTLTYRPYANGWRANPVADVVTIMAYSTTETTQRLDLFSSPQLRDAKGRPIGDAKADNVKALNYDIESFAVGTTPAVTAWSVPLVEYYCARLNQYFVTARQSNIDLLDQLGEAATCWARTGETYNALSAWGITAELVQPVLRFYGSPDAGPNTHFYTIGPRFAYAKNTRGEDVSIGQAYAEGNFDFAASGDISSLLYVAARNVMENADTAPGLHFESVDFRAWPATGSGGSKTCGAGLTAVYRLYNNQDGSRRRPDGSKLDANHRYTTKQTIVSVMVGQGWANEGVAWCVK